MTQLATKEEVFFPSVYGDREIHAVRWIPRGEVRAVLQISHGMVEYIERYEDFACYLAERGFLVTGNDHLGHGGSIRTEEDFGYFAEPDGNGAVLADLRRLTELTKSAYPDLPYFLLGHSMGSFYARQYLCDYGGELDGAIIMGTGCQPRGMVRMGKVLCGVLARVKGWRYRSEFVDNLAFGGYNKRFEPARTPKDWLTRDEKIVDAYLADARCSFRFTLNGYYSMFTGIDRLYDPGLLARMPRDLPVFFVAGAEDPVGDFSKGVLRAVEMFRKAGMQRVDCKLYPGDRHEILNELDRQTVYEDLYHWMEAVLKE
ncbi:MAG: alpha/beta fold hydrolase [Bacillota bacterium]|nr:alpha/beta fold hydrolase [Bacillota bacterium]